MDEESAKPLAAALAGRYELGHVLGRGGMAVVYHARDLKHDRDVAIKVLRAELTSGMSLERFAREVRISAGLQHPHILPMFDSGSAAGQVYCVMPYVQGETLRARMTREKALPIEDTLRLTSEVASALAYAHEQGVVHRDIKPENVLLADGHAVVADFGIAKAITSEGGPRLTQTGHAIGTPLYMSPEQAAGETDIDGRSDTYSLACMTYEMLAGEPPFAGATSQAIIARHIQQEAPSVRIVRKSVPAHVDDALQKALAKQPVDRFSTAAAFADAITSETALGAARRGRTTPWGRYAAIAAAAAVLALGARSAWNRFGSGTSLDPDLIVVAPFDVTDATLAPWRESLLDLLTRNLNGAGPIRSVPASVALAGWSGRADEASAVQLGRRTSAHTGIVGAVYRVGSDSVRVTASVFDAAGRRLIGDVEKILPAARIDRAADSLVVGILQLVGHGRALGSVRPPSDGPNAMAALKAYLQGEVYYRRTVWDSAQLQYERAVQLDSTYALAYHRLAFVQSQRGTGMDTLVYFNSLRAGRLARGLPERDSLIVTADSVLAALRYQIAFSRAASRDSLRVLFRARLAATFDVATRRIPDDPEIWYMLALYENSWAESEPGRDRKMFDALSRTIRLDSTFLPAYERAIGRATLLGGADSARRYIKAYLARHPTGAAAEAARLADALFDPQRANTAEAGRLLESASPRVLLNAWSDLLWWNDSAETALRVARRIAAHPDGRQLNPVDSSYQRFLVALTLAMRGHMREACRFTHGSRFLLAATTALGCLPPDSAEAVLVGLMERTPNEWRPSRILVFVGTLGQLRDTVLLRDLRRRGDEGVRAGGDPARVAAARALSESAQAYLALIHGDSAQALRHLLAAPDSLCILCDAQYLTKSRLLESAGRTREALAAVDLDRSDDFFPMMTVMRLQTARLAEKLGDKPKAIENYAFVAEAWQRGDPAMRDTAAVAAAALKRLGARP